MFYWDGDSWEIANLSNSEWLRTDINGTPGIIAQELSKTGDTLAITDNGQLLLGDNRPSYEFENYLQTPKFRIQNDLDYEDTNQAQLDLYYGAQFKSELLNAGAATDDIVFGSESMALSNESSTTDLSNARLRGSTSQAFHYGNGTLGTALGLGASVKNMGTGTIEKADAIRLFGVANDFGGTITNATGIVVPNAIDGINSKGINITGMSNGVESNIGLNIGNVGGGTTENYAIRTQNGRVSLGDTLQLRNTAGAALTDILDTDEGIAIIDAEGNITKRDASVIAEAAGEWEDTLF